MTFDFGAIWENRDILINGVFNTLLISFIAIPIGIFIGVVVCLLRISKRRLLRWPAIVYIELMRNTFAYPDLHDVLRTTVLWHPPVGTDNWFHLPVDLRRGLFCRSVSRGCGGCFQRPV